MKRMVFPLMLSGLMAATAHAGLRVYDASSGQSVAPSPTSRPSEAPVVEPLPSARPVTAVPAVARPAQAPVAPPTSKPAAQTGLGTALVFIKGVDFSELIAGKVREIGRVPGLDVRFYLQDQSPRSLVALSKGSLKNLPQGVDFNIDLDSRMAQAHGVVGQNVIVYRDPAGAVRHYNLVSEYANFLNHVNRLRGR